MTEHANGRLRLVKPGVLLMWCPGCMKSHQLPIGTQNHDGKIIGWDSDRDAATVEPTMRFEGCEFFLRGGTIYFLSNCNHALVGQSVPLPHFPLS